jgi:hypothetical protein
MLHGRNDGVPWPVVVDVENDDTSIRLFDTEEEATQFGYSTPLGKAYGFEVYEWIADPPARGEG